MLAELFDIEQVLVADAQNNSANERQNVALTAPGQRAARRCARSRGPKTFARSASTARSTLPRTGARWGTIEQYREEKVRGDVFRSRHRPARR